MKRPISRLSHLSRRLPGAALAAGLLAGATAGHAAGCAAEAKVAMRFMNSYVHMLQAEESHRTRYDTPRWLKNTPLVATSFVEAYQAKEREGLSKDNEIGWGKDMILNAQDHPDKGFVFQDCGNTPGVVRLTGADGNGFVVMVRVEPSPKKLLVTGSGMVNIPLADTSKK